jgi:hypothetical protein
MKHAKGPRHPGGLSHAWHGSVTAEAVAEHETRNHLCWNDEAMSYDLYFWKSAVGEPGEICDRLAEEEVEGVHPSTEVERFRAELLRRWPDLTDQIAPWAQDLDWRQPWGRTDLAPYFVSLTLSFNVEPHVVQDIVALAHESDLVVYDPQSDSQPPSWPH